MSVPNRSALLQEFFDINHTDYDFESKSECGRYTEDALDYLRMHNGNENFYHLRKYGSATQYNGHAIDVLAYDNRGTGDGTPIMEADILQNAETPGASHSWQVRETPYQPKDLMDPSEIGEPVPSNMVPWVPYNEQGFQRLKNMLAHDYARRPQDADFDVSVWAGRYFHNAYMGPERIPLGEQGALERVKPELCDALGIPNDGYLGE